MDGVTAGCEPSAKRRRTEEPVPVASRPPITLQTLIEMAEAYDPVQEYDIDLERVYKLLPALHKMNRIIGMEGVKQSVLDQMLYFLQGFQDANTDMIHTVIQGPPGVGKTMLAEIIGEVYHRLGMIQQPSNQYDNSESDSDADSNDLPFKFVVAKRSDLIGKFLGHTADKTQRLIDRALGGVLFIDETYSLGNAEGRDSFSKECIDTINQNLSEKKDQLVVIIAGYKDALDRCFFAYNEGLRRRFPFVYTIDNYSPADLRAILVKKVEELGWRLDGPQALPLSFFEQNLSSFPNFGGDMETLLLNIKIQHARRVFCEPSQRRIITHEDLLSAFKQYSCNRAKQCTDQAPPPMMYT